MSGGHRDGSGRPAKRLRRIEDLPDEIIVDILNRLNNTKEAVRICTFSQGWRNLWKLCRNLDLDFTNKAYKAYDVRRCVDHVFHNHQQGLHLDRLRIAFFNDDTIEDRCFLEWFKFANGKRVQVLDVDHRFPYHIVSKRTSPWVPPKTAIVSNSWDRLTTMSLRGLMLDDVDVELFLSRCPNLEALSMENITLENLEVKSTNPKLKRLAIQNCCQFKCINMVSAPNLESLEYLPPNGMWRCLLCTSFFGHAPKLEAIRGPFCRSMIFKFQTNVPQLQRLQLDMDVVCPSSGWNIPLHVNLKQLELRFTSTRENNFDHYRFNMAIAIIDSCRGLEKLTLKYEIKNLGTFEENFGHENQLASSQIQECLKKVQVLGWSGHKSEVQFIRNLIHISPNLEHLVLDPTPPHQTETMWFGQYQSTPKFNREFEHANKIAQQLIDYLHKRPRN